MPGEWELQRLPYRLECMAEHAVADIMNQSGSERDPGLRRIVVAFALTKTALNRSFQNSLSEHFLEEALDVGRCVSQPDFAQRVRAFVERRR